MRFMRAKGLALACVASSVVVAACGSSSNKDSGGSTASSTVAASPKSNAAATGGAPSKSSIDYALQYTSGKAGKADPSKPPVKIGFTTMIGGTPSFPEQVDAANATTKFINEQLGGIAGHPLQLDTCYIQSEEDGQKCGAQFLSDGVPVVNQALAVIGNASLYKTLVPKVPVLVGTTSTGPDSTTQSIYSYTGGGPAVIYAMSKDAKNIGLKNLALVSVGNPGGKFTMEKIAVPALDKLGVKHSKTVYYTDTATTPDIVSALQAAGGSKADGVFFDPSGPQQCTSLFNALKQLGLKITVLSTPICNAPSFIDQTGGGPDKWRFWGFNANPRVTSDPEVKVYNDIMDTYGGSKSKYIGFASSTTRDLLTLAKFGNQLGGTLTPDSVRKQILSFSGPAFMIPGQMNCQNPPSKDTVSICGAISVGSTYENGQWKGIPGIALGS
jgi:branched-chain amino acid transport system substrate-binding protein